MTRRIVSILALVVSMLWSVEPIFAADADELGDLAARVQFDYYAADARALSQDVQSIAKLKVDDSLARTLQYQIAYGEWKLAETLRAKDRSAARHAVESCLAATDKGLDAVPKRAGLPRPDVMHAELFAIQAGCSALPVDVIGLMNSYRASKAIDSAKGLQPGNPRVLLVDATLAIAHAKSPAEKGAAERSMSAAVAAFDSQPPQPGNVPDWGHAEALARLGALQLEEGNKVAARDSIERALVLASDYVWARELLTKITGKR